MPRVTGDWCQWHFIIVDGPEDDREIEVAHPGCHVSFRSRGPEFRWECEIQDEIDNCGFDTLLQDHRDEAGMFRARMRHVELRGFDWTEIDVEYEVERVVPVGDPEQAMI